MHCLIKTCRLAPYKQARGRRKREGVLALPWIKIEYYHRSFARGVLFSSGSLTVYLKAKSSVKRCHVSRCHVSRAVTELKRPSSISSAKSRSIAIASTNQRFEMASAPVAIGNAVARTRVIAVLRSGGAICEAPITKQDEAVIKDRADMQAVAHGGQSGTGERESI